MREIIQINHQITSDSRHPFRAVQICELSPALLASKLNNEVSFPPNVPVICRLSNSKQFLCRLFALPGKHLQTNVVCYVDETVQLIEDVSEKEAIEDTVPLVKEVEVIREQSCNFEEINVELLVDCSKLDLELLHHWDCLTSLVIDLMRPLIVCQHCLVKTDDSFNCGIIEIRINRTVGAHTFGYVVSDTAVVIDTICFNTKRSKTLGGLSDVKHLLVKALERASDNVLLAGPPGSGKFSLISEVARDKNYPVFEIRGLDFIKSHPGETELSLRMLFKRMEKFNKLFQRSSTTILLVKDIDTLCPKLNNRKSEDVSNISRISSQFTTLLDRYHGVDSGILVIFTTSNIESLDSKIRRPQRLGTEIFVRMPSEVQRSEIMAAVLSRNGYVLKQSFLDEIVRRTPGYVGADLELLVYTIQRNLRKYSSPDIPSIVEECLIKVRPTCLRNAIGLISGLNQTLDSIGGMEELKKTLRISVLGPLRHPESFRRFGMSHLKGILLYGPPGCAKTTIAKCLAAESRMTFVSVSAAEVYSPYVGDSEKVIARLFNQARLSAPAVIFLDEIDSLVGNRGMQGVQANDVHVRVLSTLLTEMDGIGTSVQALIGSSEDSKNILVIAATNRPDMIDDALLRPGRLTKLIHVPAPDETARFEILKKISEKVPIAEDVDLRELSKQTERYSGADLQNLCSQAALHAATLDEDVTEVNMAHFQHVLKENRPSLTSKQIEWYNQYELKRRIV